MESMENESLRQSLAGFDGVWQRVTAGAARFSPQETLEGLLPSVNALAGQYAALARRVPAGERSGLLAQGQAYQRLKKRLQGEYFIVTGRTYALPPVEPLPPERKAALRHLLLQEQSLAKTGTTAAQAAGDSPLVPLLDTLSATAEAHARQNRTRLLAWFGG
jgi:hypothetical protein